MCHHLSEAEIQTTPPKPQSQSIGASKKKEKKTVYTSALHPIHLSNPLVTPHPGPRPIRAGLLQATVAANLTGLTEVNGSTDTDAYKEGLKTIQTNVVSNYRASHPTNRVLQRSAPDISASETVLPRRYRTTLAQLRSGQCSRLLTFKHAI